MVTRAGETQLNDGEGTTPSNHDGTAVFKAAAQPAAPDPEPRAEPYGAAFGVPHVDGTVYDAGCRQRRRLHRDRDRQRRGQPTASGSASPARSATAPAGRRRGARWLTCEETETSRHRVVGRQRGTYQKDHGYVFEVFAGRATSLPKPIKAFGRFDHEALAVDPTRTQVYLSEDASGPNGLVLPVDGAARRQARAGIADQLGDTAGTLEAMQIRLDDGSILPDVAYVTSAQLGRPFKVRWVTGPRPRRPDDLGAQAVRRRHRHPRQEVRGRLEQRRGRVRRQQLRLRRHRPARPTPPSTTAWSGSTTTPTRRSRWSRTSRTSVRRRGQARPKYADLTFDGPDNVTVTPWGTLVLAEDGVGASHVLSSVPGGPTYAIARNQLNIGTPHGARVLRVHRPDVLPRRRTSCSSTSRRRASPWRSPAPGRRTCPEPFAATAAAAGYAP